MLQNVGIISYYIAFRIKIHEKSWLLWIWDIFTSHDGHPLFQFYLVLGFLQNHRPHLIVIKYWTFTRNFRLGPARLRIFQNALKYDRLLGGIVFESQGFRRLNLLRPFWWSRILWLRDIWALIQNVEVALVLWWEIQDAINLFKLGHLILKRLSFDQTRLAIICVLSRLGISRCALLGHPISKNILTSQWRSRRLDPIPRRLGSTQLVELKRVVCWFGKFLLLSLWCLTFLEA